MLKIRTQQTFSLSVFIYNCFSELIHDDALRAEIRALSPAPQLARAVGMKSIFEISRELFHLQLSYEVNIFDPEAAGNKHYFQCGGV